MGFKLKEINWISMVVFCWDVLLNLNWGYLLKIMVELFMNVFVVDLILLKMMRMWIYNYLCVGEIVFYFVLKYFLKYSLK